MPGEFGSRVTVTKDNTTLYASDRDMFVFLADEENRIELPNRREEESGPVFNGSADVVYDGTTRRARCAIRYRIRTRRGRTERMVACEAAIR